MTKEYTARRLEQVEHTLVRMERNGVRCWVLPAAVPRLILEGWRRVQ